MHRLDHIILEEFRRKLRVKALQNTEVLCKVIKGPELGITSKEYALGRGPEVIIECKVGNVLGHAFTDVSTEFRGYLYEVLSIDMDDVGQRAIFFATLNALLTLLGELNGGTHCKGHEAKKCGWELAKYLLQRFSPRTPILHIGYQPSHVEALAKTFNTVYVTDLNPQLIGRTKYGIEILNADMNIELINKSDVVLITSSSLINKTFYDLVEASMKKKKFTVAYGVSGKGGIKILKDKGVITCEYFCPYTKINMVVGKCH